MPKFIQSLDLNGNNIYNIPTIEAGESQNLSIDASEEISLTSKITNIKATGVLKEDTDTIEKSSINIISKDPVKGSESTISSSLSLNEGRAILEGDKGTTIGNTSSPVSIKADTLTETSASHRIITPKLNINNDNNRDVKTELASIANISNEGSLKNTGKVEVTGDEDLIGGNLTVKSSSSDEDTVISPKSVIFNKEEEILNKEKLTLAGSKSENVYNIGIIESHENITNKGVIDNTGDITIRNSTLTVEGPSPEEEGVVKSISVTKDSIDSDTGVTLFKNQTVNSTGTEYIYKAGTTVNFKGTTNLEGPTEASANVTISNANLSVTGNTTLTGGNTTATGGNITLGDDSHPTTIKGSTLSISAAPGGALKFSPEIQVCSTSDGTSPLSLTSGSISQAEGNDLSIVAPNTYITSTGTSKVTGASVKIIDSTPSENGLISSEGNTTLSGNNSVAISSSEGSVSIISGAAADLAGEGDVSVKSTGGSLNLGQPGKVTNIKGSNITLTHDSDNSVDVISKLTVKDSVDGLGVKITSSLIEGNNSKGLSVRSSDVKIQGSASTSIKSPGVTVGPVTGDTQVTINTTKKSLAVNNSTVSISTEEATSITAKQINLTSTGDGTTGKTVVVGDLDVVGEITAGNIVVKDSGTLTAPEGTITTLNSTTGNIDILNSKEANFEKHIKIGNIILRYDNTSKALLFEVDSQETQGGEENSNS